MVSPKDIPHTNFITPSDGLVTQNNDTVTDITRSTTLNAAMLSKYPVRSVFIADIIENSDVQYRQKPFDPEHDERDASLLATMGDPNIGLLQPIMVQELADDSTNEGYFTQTKKYKMVFGHNRRDSAKMLGWDKIDAHVARADEDVSHFTFVENASSKPQKPYEHAITLRKYIMLHPDITQAELAEKVGKTQGYISRLIQITENDTPIPLVSLFAHGMTLATALALKPIFITTDPTSHARLASLLVGCSYETAGRLSKVVVEQKMDPFTAIEMCGISPKQTNDGRIDLGKSKPMVTQSAPDTKPKKALLENATGKNPNYHLKSNLSSFSQSQSVKPEPRLLSWISPDHDGVVTELARDNGTSKFLVKKLIVKAHAEHLTYNELNDACFISAHCGNADQAVALLFSIMADKRAFSVFTQYAKISRLALRVIIAKEKDHNFKVATALRDSVINPLPLVPESPKKSGKIPK